MAGDFVDEKDPNFNFKGWRLYYNSYTLRGRFNWVVTTYGVIFGAFMLRKMFKKKEAPAITEAAAPAKKKKH